MLNLHTKDYLSEQVRHNNSYTERKIQDADNIDGLSIIIPTLNEEGNVKELVERIDKALAGQEFPYELIFIDDHSEDATCRELEGLLGLYPITVQLKCGERGKAYSLLEGFELAKYGLLAIIDADLQYPPEALEEMIDKIRAGNNVVVANRRVHKEPMLRSFFSKTFTLIFTRLLHGFKCDVQAGLKMFRRQVLDEMDIKPTAWTFDLAFLINARACGHKIESVDIVFNERTRGDSKVKVARASFEIGLNALVFKLKKVRPVAIAPLSASSMIGAGVIKQGQRFITHTTLDSTMSALSTFTGGQKVFFLFGSTVVLLGLLFWPLLAVIVVLACITMIYFIDGVFNLYLVKKSLTTEPAIAFSDEELAAVDDEILPVYTILCPLFREANIIGGFVDALEKFDYPKSKLDVLLLLEENDEETITAANALDLPPYVRVIIVPDSKPKTKPKACNYGLGFARGEFVVIYDAEDIPDPQQLKKAYLAWQRVPSHVRCLQAKLNYFNSEQNLMTRFFTAEYSTWFDVMLPGMQSLNTSIPLGGTSNHFKTADLKELEGWDPFNVTEDCDLGTRLFKRGYRCAIIESVTLEEANSQVGNWIRQRSRWLKGYMQTYLVHMRHPVEFVRQHGWHAFAFQLIVGGKVAFMVINPLMWLATISYFAAYAVVGPTIEAIYPGPILLLGVFSLIFGNFLYLYYYMIGCAARGHWQLIKYIYLMPFYWILTSVAAYMAFYQLLTRPHYWEKTRHGLSQKPTDEQANEIVDPLVDLELAPSPVARRTKLYSQGGLLLGAMIVSNGINFAFNAYLGRVLSFSEIGLVVFINTLWQVALLMLGALSSTVNHRAAFLVADKKLSEAVTFWKSTSRMAMVVVAVLTGVWLLSTGLLADFFNLPNAKSLLLFSPILTFGVIAYMNRGWLHGNLRFGAIATLFILESGSKLLIAVALVLSGLSELAYLAIPLSVAVVAVASLVMTRQNKSKVVATELTQFPRRFFLASLLAGASAVTFLNLDVVLAQHFLEPDLSGQYALLSLVGKMIYFMGALPNVFMITLVSRYEGLRRNPAVVFRYLLISTTLLTGLGFVLFGLLGPLSVPYLLGAKAVAIVPLLWAYTLAISLFTITNSIVTYHLARKNYSFTILALLVSLLMIVGIWYSHSAISDIVNVIFNVSLIGFITVTTLHLFNAVRSLVQPKPKSEQTRILIFNWRDLRHSMAGGAEVYIQRMAQEWVTMGYQITLFCGNDGQSPRRETVNGVEVVRRGGSYSVYVWAIIYYLFKFRRQCDVIVDCHNGIPFFTPLYTQKPVVCLMHHVHQEVFRRSLSRPLATLARWLERVAMPWVYRQVSFITISQSSKQGMEELGVGRGGIQIVHPGVDLDNLAVGAKSRNPLVLYLGRLAPYKSVDILLEAFKIVLRKCPEASLVIAGSGEDEQRLRAVAKQLQLGQRVIFAGSVTEVQKAQLLRRAWVMANPSFMEGWGITTIEANASGTPTVASDVAGLRDSIRNQQTGLLVPYGDIRALAHSLQALLLNRHLRKRLSAKALIWAQQFSFEKSSREFLAILNTELGRTRSSFFGRRGRFWHFGVSIFRAPRLVFNIKRFRQAEAGSLSNES